MAEPFDNVFDPFGSPALVSPQQTNPPDLQAPLVAPALPQAPVHAPPVQLPHLIGNPAQTDPRQQLMAIAALGAMLGAGPRSGIGTGFGSGVLQAQDHLRQIAQQRENERFALQQKADEQLAAQQKTAAAEQQQREQRLFAAIEKIKSDAKGATDPESYQQTIEGGSLALLQAGYRIPPTRLMQMVPYVPPEHEKKYVDAWEQWKKNPVNMVLLQQSPEKAILGTITVNTGTRAKPQMTALPVGQVAELAGEGFAKDPTGQLIVAPKEATGTSAFDLKLKSLTDVFKATHRRDPNPQEKDALLTQAIEASKVKPAAPEKLIKVEHKDAEGKDVVEYLPESEVRGKSFEKPTGAQVANRLASAKAVLQTGNDMIAQLRDPNVAKRLGPLMGRATSAADFFGNPPPEFSKLAGQIESYSLANMGVHGMRSNNGAEAIKYTLGVGRHTPESIIATIEGLNGFANHLMQNEGMDAGTAAPSFKATPDLTGLGPGAKRKFSSGPFAGQSWSIVNGQPVQVP